MAAPSPYAAADDVALTIAVARYHEDAFAEVYRRHGGAVYALAMRILWDPGVAEEVVQEVFLRLWEHPDRFDGSRGSLRSFLLMDGHARSVDRLRAEQRRRDREERSARAEAVGSYDVDLEAWDLELGEEVRRVMETLGDGERRAIELAYFGGHTYRDVAALLGEPEGTIKSRIRTALVRLKTELLDRGIDQTWITS